MVYRRAFQYFDPQEENLPDELRGAFFTTLVHARSLIEDVSGEDIEAVAENLDWLAFLLYPPLEDDELREISGIEPLDVPDNLCGVPNMVRSSWMTLAQGIMELREPLVARSRDIVRRITWEQQLAVLALAHVAEAVHVFDAIGRKLSKENDAASRWELIAREAAAAADAIATAESLQRETELQSRLDQTERKNRNRAKHAALIRHAETQRIKQAFLEFKGKHPQMSGAEAARRFYAGLSEFDQRNLCNTRELDKAVRTLTRFLAAQKKAEIPARQ